MQVMQPYARCVGNVSALPVMPEHGEAYRRTCKHTSAMRAWQTRPLSACLREDGQLSFSSDLPITVSYILLYDFRCAGWRHVGKHTEREGADGGLLSVCQVWLWRDVASVHLGAAAT